MQEAGPEELCIYRSKSYVGSVFAFIQKLCFCTSYFTGAEMSIPIVGMLAYMGERDKRPLLLSKHQEATPAACSPT